MRAAIHPMRSTLVSRSSREKPSPLEMKRRMSSPSSSTAGRPSCSWMRCCTARANVDLPDPDKPLNITTVPGAASGCWCRAERKSASTFPERRWISAAASTDGGTTRCPAVLPEKRPAAARNCLMASAYPGPEDRSLGLSSTKQVPLGNGCSCCSRCRSTADGAWSKSTTARGPSGEVRRSSRNGPCSASASFCTFPTVTEACPGSDCRV